MQSWRSGWTMHVEWLHTALNNLQEEATYLARDNPRAAAQFIAAIKYRVEQLARLPEQGREGRIVGTREWTVIDRPYLIPYRVRQGRLQVLRIIHTRRALTL